MRTYGYGFLAMTKTIAFVFAVSIPFLLTACDFADEPTTNERAAEVQSDAEGEDDKRGEHAKFAVDKLCSELECTEAQATKIAELFAAKHESRDDGDRDADREAREVARAEHNKTIAAAFRADTFDPSVLDRAKPDREGEHAERMIAFATELHAILTPEQRAKLADKVADGGPMFFIGKHGKHHGEGPHKDGPRGDGPHKDGPHGNPSERVAEHVGKLCEKVTCTPEQQTQLTQLFTAAHEARRVAHEGREAPPDSSAVADLLRADTLDAAKLRAVMDAGKAEHEQRKAERDKAFGDIVVQVHAILTPEQRAVVAGLIETDGVHALMGGKHGKFGKHGKDHKRG